MTTRMSKDPTRLPIIPGILNSDICGRLAAALVVTFVTAGFAAASESLPSLESSKPVVKVIEIGASEKGFGVIQGMGSVSCPRTLELGFDETGVIAAMLVDEGDRVREGQTLATLDDSVLRSEKSATEARLKQALAEVKFFANELEKKKGLFKKDALSDTDLKTAELELEKATAKVELVKAEIATVETKLKKRVLKAPISGVIAERHADVGSVMMPGSNRVLDLIQCRYAFAEVELGERMFPLVRTGQRAKVHVDALAGKVFYGGIVLIGHRIDKKHRTFTVKIRIDNPDLELRPGMFARAEILLPKDLKSVRIPRTALIVSESDGGSVMVVKNGIALKRKVTVGSVTDDTVQIVAGLRRGDLVIVEGQGSVADLEEVSVEAYGK